MLSFVQGNLVSGRRKSAGVPYPNAYATPEQCKESKAAYKLNCAQRAHSNLLENMSQTMMTMMVAGLSYPRVTAALGAGWVVSRILYAYGYITSDDPKGRGIGGGFWIMQGGIWGLSAWTALQMI